jgi:hypothetical protein
LPHCWVDKSQLWFLVSLSVVLFVLENAIHELLVSKRALYTSRRDEAKLKRQMAKRAKKIFMFL